MAIPQLVISSMGFPPYSTRAATQTFSPIRAASQLDRLVDASLIDLSDSAFQKYASTIICSDQQVPQFVWPGTQVTVDCIFEFSYKTIGGSAWRVVVSTRVKGDFTFFRPRLTMRVAGYSINHDDWRRVIGWSLELEEV